LRPSSRALARTALALLRALALALDIRQPSFRVAVLCRPETLTCVLSRPLGDALFASPLVCERDWLGQVLPRGGILNRRGDLARPVRLESD
jgi:hypothetical protein